MKLGFQTADKAIRRTVSTGIKALDTLLEGGLELGTMHLFYGDRALHKDLLKMAAHIQLPEERGGLSSPTIIIDSANIMKIDALTEYAFEFELEPEHVMEKVYISRAFNSSQTYDLVMNQLESFLDRIPARLLIVSGLPDLYLSEGITGEGLQQITHMATKVKRLTLQRNLATLVTTQPSPRNLRFPAGGKTLSSSAQVHVYVEESKSYTHYTLAKHPQFPVRRTSRAKSVDFGWTLPLSHFLNQEEERE